jgi:hypothetical protein
MINIYSIVEKDAKINVQQINTDKTLFPGGYTSLTSIRVKNDTVLYAYNQTAKTFDAYKISANAPCLTGVISNSSGLNLFAWDIVKSFNLGNKPYLLTYEAKSGTMGFYEINDDFSVSLPYTFENQRSWPTQNFSEVTPFVSLGLLYVLCYDKSKGTVAIFSLDVIATSTGGVPPLNMLNVWYHQWAKEWQDFAFFTLGQSNFFFKINKGPKLNVNIDHVQDNPTMGTVEIGSYLQNLLPNAIDVSLAATIPWAGGEPYLATIDSQKNELNIYRIHADCQGWTNLNTTPVNACNLMITFRLDNTSYILIYS